ncbi:hypothetical protein ACFWPQ_28185 [Streptomyces sp. NPDC058464]|uniref:hypothetical protein n=1 Tax=Streptomyces sp. NPDC058464 TaxID=3346511 RepID=UPI00364CAEF3
MSFSTSVIAAGERWPDERLRAALEDLLGAGALVSELGAQGAGPPSTEAAAAKAGYEDSSTLVPVRDGDNAFAPGRAG